VRPNIGLRKRSRFYCITSSSILVSEIEYVLILLPHHTSKYPQIDLHRCCWNAIFTNVRIYLSYYVILWANKSKEHKLTGCSYLCFPTWHSVLGDFKTYCICFWSICRAEPLDNLLHGHFLLSVVLYYQSSRKYIFLVQLTQSPRVVDCSSAAYLWSALLEIIWGASFLAKVCLNSSLICLASCLIYSTTTVLVASTSQCIFYVQIPRSCFLQMPHSAAKEAPSPQTTTFSIIPLLCDPRDSSLKYSRWCNKLVSVLLWSKVRRFIIFYDHRS